MAAELQVEVVLAMPRRCLARRLSLAQGATVADAVAAAAFPPELTEAVDGFAVHGLRAREDQPLRDGDRVELLRPLQLDPMEARRRRAASPPRGRG